VTLDPAKAVVLAGSGRSGTTWLANILAANPNFMVSFEPFDRRRVPQAAPLPLRPYVRPDEDYPQWEPYIRSVLNGSLQNEWVNRLINRPWAWRLLVKKIRGTMILGWPEHIFGCHIVFIIRHPCAIVLSRIRSECETHIDELLDQPQLVGDYLEPHLDTIQNANSEVEKHALMWCIENYVPLHQLQHMNWIFLTYEQFFKDPQEMSARVLKKLGISKTLFTQRALSKTSITASPDSAILSEGNPLLEWQDRLSQKKRRHP